jgi:hypothetical protein
MKIKIHKKAFVFGIIIILFCSNIFPGISSKKVKPERDEIINDETMEVEEELATLTFNTFNENGKKENKIELPLSKAKYIFNLFEKLRNMTISHPNSQETLYLKKEFINLLEEYGLIPRGMSTSDIQPLINPHGAPDNSKTHGRTGFLRLIIEVLFSNRFNHLRLFGPLDYPSDWSIFCNVAGYGYGIPLPLFILPRPRAITVWGATDAITAVGSLLMPKSFVAIGNQQGICLGFVGVGLTIAFFGFMGYGMLGYSLYTAVRAQEIERYNNEPAITNENPPDGSMNVPISLNELSFRLTDGDGDLMSYSVTTSPDIGGGSGNNKGNGVYSVPVSGLDSNTDYTWHVSVDDGYDIVDKTFSFRTEAVAPVISSPSPSDGELDVSVDLSQLSFHLKDYQGDLMDYTVTTSPDIGVGSGSGVGDGTYSVDVSGLDYLTEYTWYISATDGEHQTNKIYSFKTAPIMIFDPFDEGWQYRKKITINHTKVDGDLENFPVLISLTDTDLRDKAQGDGDDILFMDGPGVATRLYHEIEYYEDSNGELVAWVNIPSLSDGVDTVFYMYYGNPGCSSQEYPERVWNSGYEAVFHFDETGGNIIDSTSNGYYGTACGDPEYQQTDTITGGYSIYFDSGEDDYFDDVFPGNIINPLIDNGHTIEIWCKFDGIPSGDNLNALWFSHTGVSDRYYCMARVGQYYTNLREGGEFWGTLDNTIWHHVLIDVNSEYDWFAYLDRVHQYTKENFGNYNLGEPVDIAGADGDMCWIGWIDEFRLSNVQRNQVWRDATYETISNPSSFFNVGPEESAP